MSTSKTKTAPAATAQSTNDTFTPYEAWRHLFTRMQEIGFTAHLMSLRNHLTDEDRETLKNIIELADTKTVTAGIRESCLLIEEAQRSGLMAPGPETYGEVATRRVMTITGGMA